MRYRHFLLFAMLPLLSACLPKKPSACFTYSVNGNAVSFYPSCSENADDYIWLFGDGTTSNEANPTHHYNATGTFPVALTVFSSTHSNLFVDEVDVVVDSCWNVFCDNGECVSGTCVCDPGYEGPTCSTPVNAKFNGTYSLTEYCNTAGAATYSVTLVPVSGSLDRFQVTGLWMEPQFSCTAFIDGNGLLSIPRVPIPTVTSNPREIASNTMSCTEDGTTITITYTVYDGNTSTIIDLCVASLFLQ